MLTKDLSTVHSGNPDVQHSSWFIGMLAWVIVIVPAGWDIYLAAARAARIFK